MGAINSLLGKYARAGAYVALASLLVWGTGCGGNGGSSIAPHGGSSGPAPTPLNFNGSTFPVVGNYTGNSMNISVNGAGCGAFASALPNLPCVSVTVCSISQPATCETIDDILLDTGSPGLRIFKSSFTNSSVLSGLAAVKNGSSALGECVLYGGGSVGTWGSVDYAYVQLAGEPMVAVPIQVVDANFNTPPSICRSPNTTLLNSANDTGYNGILGVQFVPNDCGSACTTNPNIGYYYTCTGGNCSAGATVQTTAQVTNVVSAYAVDNNGVILDIPGVGATGSASVTGTLTIGIGTRNAIAASPTVFNLGLTNNSNPNDFGFITNNGATFDSTQADWLAGILDSGSNLVYFPANLPDCKTVNSSLAGFYCPAATQAFTATNTNFANHAVNSTINFSVANANTLLTSNPTSNVFNNIGGFQFEAGTFVWGMPFFLGRTTYFGMTGTTATINSVQYTGPFFAY